MPVSDGQIALGILQLVALALPVFAILAEIYFSMAEEQPNFLIGFVLISGGGALLVSALISVQYLSQITTSELIYNSLIFITIGLVLIGGFLYLIFDLSKADLSRLQSRNEEHQQLSKSLIGAMEEHDVQSVAELRDTETSVPDEIRDDATLEDIRQIRDESTELLEGFVISEKSFLSSLKSKPVSTIFHPDVLPMLIFIVIAILSALLYPELVTSPIGVAVAGLIGWITPSVLAKLRS